MVEAAGDTDACVPTWGTVDWIDSLNLKIVSPWKPWRAPHLDGTRAQRAGCAPPSHPRSNSRCPVPAGSEWSPTVRGSPGGADVKTYEHNFTFATVQGAGHLVPTYKPKFALTMLTKWLKGEPLAP